MGDVRQHLDTVAALAGFLLQTGAEWLACALLARIMLRNSWRFLLWLGLLVLFATQWSWLWISRLKAAPDPGTAVAAVAGGPVYYPAPHLLLSAPVLRSIVAGIRFSIFLYLGVLALLLVREAQARLRLRNALRYRVEPSGRVLASFTAMARSTNLPHCRVWVLPGLVSPATIGWHNPQILLPEFCERQDAAELAAVFWHELTHVARKDALWNALARACQLILWFHPAAHCAVTALHAERELACDAHVASQHPESRDAYASCLVRFARLADAPRSYAALSTELTSATAFLDLRVRSILRAAPSFSPGSRAWRTAAAILIATLYTGSVPLFHLNLGLHPALVSVSRAVALPPAIAAFQRRSSFKGKLAATPEVVAPEVPLTSIASAAAAGTIREPDPQLAARNRVGANVVVNLTGGDHAPAFEDESETEHSRAASPAPTGPSLAAPSWTKVAIQAATGLKSLGGDHDHDRR